MVTARFCRSCSVRSLKVKTSARSPPTGPMIRAAATLPSSTARPLQSSRSARTAGRGTKTARPQSPATKRCVPPGIMEGRSGSAGPDITSEAGSRPKCSASRHSGNASPRETQTAKLPKSKSKSPSSSASMRSAPLRSSAWPKFNRESGNHASRGRSATTLIQGCDRTAAFYSRENPMPHDINRAVQFGVADLDRMKP